MEVWRLDRIGVLDWRIGGWIGFENWRVGGQRVGGLESWKVGGGCRAGGLQRGLWEGWNGLRLEASDRHPCKSLSL